MRFLSQIVKLFILVIVVSACRKEILYEGIEGELKGRVSLIENFSLSDQSGVEVSVDGAPAGFKATTDINGSYSISGLKTGIYDVIFTKPGFSTFKLLSLQYIGGNIPFYAPNAFLYKLPTVNVTSLKVDTGKIYPWSNPFVRVTVSVSGPSATYLRYYVGDSPDVDYTDYLATDLVYFGAAYYPNGFPFYLQDSFLSKLPKRKQLYMVVYPGASGVSYTDITTGNEVYPVNIEKASAKIPLTIPK